MDKTACFIDDGYLQNVLKDSGKLKFGYSDEQSKWKTDYSKLVSLMKGEEKLLRTYYYTCKRENLSEEDDKKQESFFYSLDKLSQFECKFGRLEYRGEDKEGKPIYIQKQVDNLITIDIVMLSFKHLITKATVISGDADLIPAIKFAKNEGVIVEVLYFPGSTSNELLKTVDIATELNYDWLEKIRLTK